MQSERLSTELVLDVESTLARLGGDQELFTDMIGFFMEDSPQLMADLRAAVNSRDASAVRRSAHALKGIIASCGGVRAARAAQQVESAAEAGETDHLLPSVDLLTAELAALTEAARRYRY